MRGQETVRSAVTPKPITMEEVELAKIYYANQLTTEDRRWVKEHLELAGKKVPEVDISWLSFTNGS